MPGAGNIDFAALNQALTERPYGGFVSAELGLAYIMEPADACRETLEFLRKTF